MNHVKVTLFKSHRAKKIKFRTNPFVFHFGFSSREKDYNPNFQEIKGDWRERLKKKKTAT